MRKEGSKFNSESYYQQLSTTSPGTQQQDEKTLSYVLLVQPEQEEHQGKCMKMMSGRGILSLRHYAT
jgi:hypothetical protein